ncbi:hypothetical protein F4780DRAFT_489669 [Xylariomycetidae sp. FL0641]|nr:hypothetical protein F4780DRAFT_489669 [Xylariomycetidae sp. FL0641]
MAVVVGKDKQVVEHPVDATFPVEMAGSGHPAENMPPLAAVIESSGEDDDAVTMAEKDRDTDSISGISTNTYISPSGFKAMTVEDARTKTVYEAWEIINSKDTNEVYQWRSFAGIRFSTSSRSEDGFVMTKPLLAYEQGDLANMYVDAMRAYETESGREGSYNQDLANRVSKLQMDVYDRLETLVEDRNRATNTSPFRHREWRVVLLTDGELQVTDTLPERKKKGFFRRKRAEPYTFRRFVILRGQEVKTTKERDGWTEFTRGSNPWRKLDLDETRDLRRQRAQHLENLEKHHRIKLNERQARMPPLSPPFPPSP